MKICWVGIIGRPNVGKSTLLNKIINYDLSIVSNKAQTTRDNILGIYNDEEYQVIFIDTPGIHKPQSKFGKKLNEKAIDAAKDVDAILFLQPVNQKISSGDLMILNHIKNIKNKIAVITKIDLAKNNEVVNEKIIELNNFNFQAILPTAQNKDKLINNVINEIKKYAYKDQRYYEEDDITDKSELFLAKEIIRSCAINNLNDELPHSIAIEIIKYEINEENEKRNIEAIIYCKKESQKGIIIGQNGSLIKKIGMCSRKLISEKFGFQTNLILNVKVNKNWINNDKEIKKFGY